MPMKVKTIFIFMALYCTSKCIIFIIDRCISRFRLQTKKIIIATDDDYFVNKIE